MPQPTMPVYRRDAAATRTFGKRVHVVDARPLVRWALTHMLNDSEDLMSAGESLNATDALNAIFALSPDVVLIDCSPPDDSGWLLARTAKERYPDLGIVIISGTQSDEHLLRALDAGASAYLANTSSVQDIMAAIRHAAVSASSFSAVGLAQALRRRSERSTRVTLSAREREVLGLLREGKSVPEVAATLYLSLSTAKTYVARVYEKLGAKNRAQALMSAVRLGLFDQHPPTAVAV
jgi:DNA-binding NarL/FixJ family response regulator